MRWMNLSLLCVLLILSAVVTPLSSQQTDSPAELTPDGTLRRIRVPILMYHYVSPLPEGADEIRIGLTVTPDTFRQHVEYLHREGYATVTFDELNRALLTGTALPPKPIMLTFDDGHIDHYTNVFPVLRRFGYTGAFFIITGLADAAAADYLTWDQIAEMAAAGMQMEAHTKTHPDLRQRDHAFLVYEVLGSVESLEAHTGMRPLAFAYPAGRYDESSLRVVESVGIVRAVTTEPGALHTTDNRLLLPRVRINGNLTVEGLAWLLGSL